jgi:hypothetical protein
MNEYVNELMVALVPFILMGIAWLRGHLALQQANRIDRVARIAVQAAEMYKRGAPPDDKFAYAIEAAMGAAKKYNLRLTYDQWGDMIESTVYEMKVSREELTPPPRLITNETMSLK